MQFLKSRDYSVIVQLRNVNNATSLAFVIPLEFINGKTRRTPARFYEYFSLHYNIQIPPFNQANHHHVLKKAARKFFWMSYLKLTMEEAQLLLSNFASRVRVSLKFMKSGTDFVTDLRACCVIS